MFGDARTLIRDCVVQFGDAVFFLGEVSLQIVDFVLEIFNLLLDFRVNARLRIELLCFLLKLCNSRIGSLAQCPLAIERIR